MKTERNEKPNIPELDTIIIALWRAIARALAHGRKDDVAIRAGEMVEKQLRLTHRLWVGSSDENRAG